METLRVELDVLDSWRAKQFTNGRFFAGKTPIVPMAQKNIRGFTTVSDNYGTLVCGMLGPADVLVEFATGDSRAAHLNLILQYYISCQEEFNR
jgi:hypothetical protein